MGTSWNFWIQRSIYLEEFLSTLGLGHILQQGSGIIEKSTEELTEGGIAGGPYGVDYKKDGIC